MIGSNPGRAISTSLLNLIRYLHVNMHIAIFASLEDPERLFSTNIDLVEPGSVRNPYFRRSMEETKIEIYAAS